MAARRLFSLMFLAALLSAAPAQAGPPAFRCGVDFTLEVEEGVLPPEGLVRSVLPLAESQGTSITLQAGSGLSGNADALAAWQRAVATWESHLQDDVSIVLEGDLQSMGGEVLGATCFRLFDDDYDVIRNAMAADAGSGETVLAGLPTSAQLSLIIPPLWINSGSSIAAKSNLKALGFDMSFDNAFPDGSIIFNSDFLSLFDFDSSDGIDSTKYDFEAIVTHEIGHALGFYSIVDQVDLLLGFGIPGGVFMTTLDHLRMLPGDGADDFTLNPRVLTTGGQEPSQAVYDGTQDLAMSTGVQTGDGYQASHWKPDEISGTYIGMMDPTIAAGVHQELTEEDLRVFGLMGWDIGATTSVLPDQTGAPLLSARPNPFRGRTVFSLSLESGSTPVALRVVDVQGRQVRAWASEAIYGRTEISWDGRDAGGRRLPGGVYYVELRTTDGRNSMPVVLLH